MPIDNYPMCSVMDILNYAFAISNLLPSMRSVVRLEDISHLAADGTGVDRGRWTVQLAMTNAFSSMNLETMATVSTAASSC